jgi:hypothetical protein
MTAMLFRVDRDDAGAHTHSDRCGHAGVSPLGTGRRQLVRGSAADQWSRLYSSGAGAGRAVRRSCGPRIHSRTDWRAGVLRCVRSRRQAVRPGALSRHRLRRLRGRDNRGPSTGDRAVDVVCHRLRLSRGFPRPDVARAPMIAVIALATVASGVIAWRFIFPVPAVFSGVLALAYVAAG